MKTIGFIGGTSWFSTASYYQTINQMVNERLGGANAARLILYSVNFQEYHQLQESGRWDAIEQLYTDIALKLEHAGAECILLCANTPHLIADQLVPKLKVPFIHIADETAKAINKAGKNKVLLLGTKFTMERPFFIDRLSQHNIEVVIPESEEREIIHSSIVNEFTKGIFSEEIKQKYQNIIRDSISNGAEGVIFGCTEIALLLKPEECALPVFDTARIHSSAAVEFAIGL